MDNTLLYVMYVNTGNLSPCMMHDHRHRRSGGVVQPTVQLVGQLKNQYWNIGVLVKYVQQVLEYKFLFIMSMSQTAFFA